MSRAFVKESDGAEGQELPELLVSPHRNLVTPRGLRQIEATVERLQAEAKTAVAVAVDGTESRLVSSTWVEAKSSVPNVAIVGRHSMAEVFIIGVLVSLVKIAAMASVVIGISFWAYVGFAVCFTASLSSLDRFQMWREIEACTA